MSSEIQQPGQTLTLPDGRKLGYLILGEGKPVLYFHGLPGSRLEILLSKGKAFKNIQIIGVDRPGFGLSTFAPNLKISDFIADVSLLANHLGIEKFAVLGISGGAHYVITCAALLKNRVTRVVAASGLSLPLNTTDMSLTNKLFAKVNTWPVIGTFVQKQYRNMILKSAKDLQPSLNQNEGRNYSRTYLKISENITLILNFKDFESRSLPEAYRQGPDAIKAVIQEWKLVKKGWDVDLSQISHGVVYIWHGSADKGVPVSNAYRNAKAIPGAYIEIFEGKGHGWFFSDQLDKLAEILSS